MTLIEVDIPAGHEIAEVTIRPASLDPALRKYASWQQVPVCIDCGSHFYDRDPLTGEFPEVPVKSADDNAR